jgi:hypothetical protein
MADQGRVLMADGGGEVGNLADASKRLGAALVGGH